MLWEICSWETLGPAIHLDVILARSTYLSIVPDHVQFFMEKGLFQQDNAPQMLWFRSSLRSTTTRLKLDLSSEFSRSQSSQASVRCAGQTSLIHGAPPCNLQGLNDLLLTMDSTRFFRGLVESMPRRVRAALAAKDKVMPDQRQLVVNDTLHYMFV